MNYTSNTLKGVMKRFFILILCLYLSFLLEGQKERDLLVSFKKAYTDMLFATIPLTTTIKMIIMIKLCVLSLSK